MFHRKFSTIIVRNLNIIELSLEIQVAFLKIIENLLRISKQILKMVFVCRNKLEKLYLNMF